MIRKFSNPKTQSYRNFKSLILGNNFPWYRSEELMNPTIVDSWAVNVDDVGQYSNTPFWGHSFLQMNHYKPYPEVSSPYIDNYQAVLAEIFNFHKIPFALVVRLCVNLVYPNPHGPQQTIPHVDHPFPHKAMMIYLTDAGGEFICEDEKHHPREDDIIVIDGEEHSFVLPQKKPRVTLIATYIEEDDK